MNDNIYIDSKKLDVNQYNIRIEVLSGLFIGSGDTYLSSEWFYYNDKIFLASFDDLIVLYNKGFISLEELKDAYGNMKEKVKNNKTITSNMKTIKCLDNIDDKNRELNIFSKRKLIQNEDVYLEPIIYGSSIKGLLRTGYLASKINNLNYVFNRHINKKVKSNLVLKGIKEENNTINRDNKNQYRNNIEIIKQERYLEQKLGIKNMKMLFSKVLCHDCCMDNGELAVDEIMRTNRKNNSVDTSLSTYNEIALKGSVFRGNVKFKDSYYGEKNKNLCIAGLKKLGYKIIEQEEKIMTQILGSKDVEDFYDMLKKQQEKPNQCVVKMGVSGILSKTYMSFDNENLKNDDFLPYTIAIMKSSRLPLGWVKINIDT